ncbi:MAG: hypothetical protein E5X48_27870 [Mesorhizobium sp.]|nr:MAG: hypothetical protein E5X48_27870 [Mesorhizobium sp.]
MGTTKRCRKARQPEAVGLSKALKLAGQHPSLACRPSPPQGGRSMSPRLSPISSVVNLVRRRKLPISPLEGEMAGRPEGGVTERGVENYTRTNPSLALKRLRV